MDHGKEEFAVVSPQVLNRRGAEAGKKTGAVYIGRPSKWGNPFAYQDDSIAPYRVATRIIAVRKYWEWLQTQPHLIQAAKWELKGRNLLCFCAPELCHGDVLLAVSNDRPVILPEDDQLSLW
jgi:hypothetical protein